MRWLLVLMLALMCWLPVGCVDADDDGGGTDTVIMDDADPPASNTTIIEDNDPPADADVDVDVDATPDTTL
jgi:hypothetical protein